MPSWIHLLLWSLVSILILYFIAILFSKRTIVKSQKVSSDIVKNAICYYLPKGHLKITSKAKVKISKDATSKEIVGVELLEQSFKHEKIILPDQNEMYSLQYVSSVLSNDKLTFKIDADGLLELVSVMSEDKSVGIIKTVVGAPAAALAANTMGKMNLLQSTPVEEKIEEFSLVIQVDPFKAQKQQLKWDLLITDSVTGSSEIMDLGFEFSTQKQYDPPQNTEDVTSGILTRPLGDFKFKIVPSQLFFGGNKYVEFDERLPDVSKLMSIEINRSMFAKRTSKVTLAKGLLTEYVVEKPSEFEGAISIPVEVGKAIFSIPGALFNFSNKNTKADLQNQKSLLDLERELIKARNDLEVIKKKQS